MFQELRLLHTRFAEGCFSCTCNAHPKAAWVKSEIKSMITAMLYKYAQNKLERHTASVHSGYLYVIELWVIFMYLPHQPSPLITLLFLSICML